MADLWKLLRYLVRSAGELSFSRGMVFLVIATSIASGAASTALLALINTALSQPESAKTTAGQFILLCMALPVARFASQVLLVRLSQGIVYGMRMKLSRQILATPQRKIEELGLPRLLSSLTDDIGRIANTLAGVPLLLMHMTVVLGCLVYMGWLSPTLLLAVVGVTVVGILTYQLPTIAAVKRFTAAREQWDTLFKCLEGLTKGSKELKLHRQRRHDYVEQLLEPAAAAMRRNNVSGGTIYAMANSWGQILFFVLIGGILYLAPEVGFVSQEILTGFTLAVLYMVTPLDVILNTLPGLGRAVVAGRKIEELGLSLENTDTRADGAPIGRPKHWKRLELRGVTHSYYREDIQESFTVGPVDFELTPGELVFIVGGNGSGKTSLAKILVGLYAPEDGEIRLDGEVVDDAGLDDYRQHFSVIFSDFFLFDRLYGLGEEVDGRARDCLDDLQLSHKVTVDDGVLSTLDLSQGQRKRLALLTAFLEEAPIYLFDEWAADQDPYFKRIFYCKILPELRDRGKTVLVISHDDAYYPVADRILKIDEGKIVYDGEVDEFWQAAMPSFDPRNPQPLLESP